MPLETGNFIPELDDNNPLGSDNVSLGDDHMRLIKRCVTGSFAAFVGTTGTPKSVTLTEDEINQLAVDVAANIIDIATNVSNISANLANISTNTGDIALNTADIVTINADAAFKALAETISGAWVFTPGLNDLALSGDATVEDLDTNPKKLGWRNPSVKGANADRALTQNDEAQVLLVSSNNIDLTTPALQEFTTIRLIVTGSGCTLAPSGAAINVLDGFGAPVPAASGINIAENSVVEIVYVTATTVQLFGNGITVI